eukprot:TRINITY_DN1401_c0_g1_i2.p1 TRINITY_DN1401_c0_g1~~TRINITY_DN1401_c0_g1_i2.p1  ORF type:complete len:370 (+),score=70.51 TRINITY_DN1401_c0_g1_i2:54-1112(+)
MAEAQPQFKWKVGDIGKTPNERRELFREFVLGLQDDICKTLGELDGEKEFIIDEWTKEDGSGKGKTRVIQDGKVFESGGCNWSELRKANLPPSILKKHPHLEGQEFYATGVSMVIHPRNPHCPTVHLNYRYFEAGKLDSTDVEQNNVWWFGGGMDLTPWILYDDDAKLFHQKIKDACSEASMPEVFEPLKRYADEYFRNKHRNESRGIGGLFYDYLNGDSNNLLYMGEDVEMKKREAGLGTFMPSKNWGELFAFSKAQGAAFLPAYVEIINRRKDIVATDEDRDWQLHRRGRYVEFNLIHDRGTLFGLQVGGRVESILMSLPALVKWSYMYKPKNDQQKRLIEVLEKPINWI